MEKIISKVKNQSLELTEELGIREKLSDPESIKIEGEKLREPLETAEQYQNAYQPSNRNLRRRVKRE